MFVPRGATGFGSMAVQLAVQFGARVITSAHTEDERSYLESLQLDIGKADRDVVRDARTDVTGQGVN